MDNQIIYMSYNDQIKRESVEVKEQRLSNLLSAFDSLAIAFSRGVDSTLLSFQDVSEQIPILSS